MSTALDELAGNFAALRPHLVSVAYRLTGTLSDAEDAVQESWLRLSGMDERRRAAIEDHKGWLTTVVSRICLDRLRSAVVRRERYVGEWLPEPVLGPLGTPSSEDPLAVAVRDDGMRMAAMVVLDRLTPEQRVAFVLHDAFSVPFGEIAEILGCTTDAARQHGSRGRRAVADADPPPRTALAEQQQIIEKFMTAMLTGDIQAVAEVLHPDVVLVGDGGGKARTAVRTVAGFDKVTRLFQGLMRMYDPAGMDKARLALVNGDLGVYLPPQPGSERYRALDEHVDAFVIRDGKIVAIYDMANPDKLTTARTRAGL
ncbi:sigma-70 family RNA polymerase sigma factor [Amycolatopsis keratiniphila]|uniref:RNA polymerase sigma factor SigJ n=1 Tax=Amycolatopsis keratiniphila subsp. keratiniphila TaxID=227715 RepID=A0A1W2LZV9_9PSEU|nr:sigma-70 family RNA polymerase sigma factor [Amycolatopsis keratiniphila]ONF72897.1 RNA polymerase sigma factor SigJ [Amycolatopsis keratiniphila subsp. keratiniphila]